MPVRFTDQSFDVCLQTIRVCCYHIQDLPEQPQVVPMSFDLLHPRLEFADRSDDLSHSNESLVITEECKYHSSLLQSGY